MNANRPRSGRARPWRVLPQRRLAPGGDQLRPQRWNWQFLIQPLDRTVVRQAARPLQAVQLAGLRYFWLDGLLSAISDNFTLTFIPLFALAYGASNGEVGWIVACGNLLGTVALFPGARFTETRRWRKPLVLWSAGGWGRLALLGLAAVPWAAGGRSLALGLILALNGLRAFMANFANPAWTAIVADLVPDFMRGRYFGSRNLAMGVAALAVLPLAGWLIRWGGGGDAAGLGGYQLVFLLAFAFGALSTWSFWRIPEPPARHPPRRHERGELRRALGAHPAFLGLVASAFVWNLALQLAAPFFNVYLVRGLGASPATVGVLASISGLSALFGQWAFGRWLDGRGAIWVQRATGLLIPALPVAWIWVSDPWQVGLINVAGGFLWAGYNLSNFNLLLELAPDEQRPRAVALYQSVVFASAVFGPLLGGALADAYGFALVFALSGVGRLLGILVFLRRVARPARERAARA